MRPHSSAHCYIVSRIICAVEVEAERVRLYMIFAKADSDRFGGITGEPPVVDDLILLSRVIGVSADPVLVRI